jgi:hypothetical protein
MRQDRAFAALCVNDLSTHKDNVGLNILKLLALTRYPVFGHGQRNAGHSQAHAR